MIEVRLMAQAARTILDAITDAGDRETGGTLVGPDHQEGGLLITHATGPGPRARRGPTSFSFDREWSQRRLDRWNRSMRVDWIGDWHLHPAGLHQPSSTDYESALRLISDSHLRFRRFLLVIAQPPERGGVALNGFVVAPHRVTRLDAAVATSIAENDSLISFRAMGSRPVEPLMKTVEGEEVLDGPQTTQWNRQADQSSTRFKQGRPDAAPEQPTH